MPVPGTTAGHLADAARDVLQNQVLGSVAYAVLGPVTFGMYIYTTENLTTICRSTWVAVTDGVG